MFYFTKTSSERHERSGVALLGLSHELSWPEGNLNRFSTLSQ